MIIFYSTFKNQIQFNGQYRQITVMSVKVNTMISIYERKEFEEKCIKKSVMDSQGEVFLSTPQQGWCFALYPNHIDVNASNHKSCDIFSRRVYYVMVFVLFELLTIID